MKTADQNGQDGSLFKQHVHVRLAQDGPFWKLRRTKSHASGSCFTEMHFLLAVRPHNSISLNMKPHADQHRALPANVWWKAFWRASTKCPATQDVPHPPCGAHLNCPFSILYGKHNFGTEGATSANMLQSGFFQILRSRPRYPAALKIDATRAMLRFPTPPSPKPQTAFLGNPCSGCVFSSFVSRPCRLSSDNGRLSL